MKKLFILLIFLITFAGCDIKPQVNGSDIFGDADFSLALEELIVDPELEPIVERLAETEAAIIQLQQGGIELQQANNELNNAVIELTSIINAICTNNPVACEETE